MPDRDNQLDRYGHPRTRYIYSDKRNGYYVSLPRVLGGKTRFFSATRYGNINKAYEAALAWRDRRLPNSHLARVSRQNTQGSTGYGMQDVQATSLGKPGIEIGSFGAHRRLNVGPEHTRANIQIAGQRSAKTRTFTIAHHGTETALRYALRERLAWERDHYGHYSRIGEGDWLQFILLCYEQHGRRKIKLDEIEHPGTLSHPNETGVQAHVTVGGKEYSAWFGFREYGSVHEAHVAGILWCVQTGSQKGSGCDKQAQVS